MKGPSKAAERRSPPGRHCNLDAERIVRLNAVVRGVARYFATSFSTVDMQFRHLDRWLRMRLRCMKYKRKSRPDNWRLKVRYLQPMGVVFLSDYLETSRCSVQRLLDLISGQFLWGRPEPEKGTPVNMRN